MSAASHTAVRRRCGSRPPRLPAASAATCRCSTSTSGSSNWPKIAEFDRSPLTDIKHCSPCDIALIEGGCCNAENVHVLRELRANAKILVAVGACAINGGLPALRNQLDVGDILNEVYHDPGPHRVPNDPELPLLFDKVYPVNEVVRVDYFIPGCPPSGDAHLEISQRSDPGTHAASRS